MITDEDLDRMVASVRPADMAPWTGFGAARGQLLDELTSYRGDEVAASDVPAAPTTMVDLRSRTGPVRRRRVLVGVGTAAAVLAIAVAVAVVGGSDRSTVVEPSATVVAEPSATLVEEPSATSDQTATTSSPATPAALPPTMVPPAPWAPTSPMLDLLALPRCSDAAAVDDLAAWTVQQLSFMVALDPAGAEVLDPAEALARTPIDTLAVDHAACTLAIEVEEAEAVAALATDGTTLARTVRHADLGVRPARQRVPNGDDTPSWTLGNGTTLNAFATGTTEIEPITVGVESFGDVLTLQLAEPLVVDGLENRLSTVTTAARAPSELLQVSRPPVMWLPTLVPQGFGECVPWSVTGEYTRYCRSDETIDVLNGPWDADGAAAAIDGRAVRVVTDASGTTIGGQEGVYLRVSSTTVPYDELAALYASIPDTDPELHDLRTGAHDLGEWWQAIDRIEWTAELLAALGWAGTPTELAPGTDVLVGSVLPVGAVPGSGAVAFLSVGYRGVARRLLGPEELVHPVDLGRVDGVVGDGAVAVVCGGIAVKIEDAGQLGADLTGVLQVVLAQLPPC